MKWAHHQWLIKESMSLKKCQQKFPKPRSKENKRIFFLNNRMPKNYGIITKV